MAGRKRKPVALKKLEGTFRKDRSPEHVVELPNDLAPKPEWAKHDAIADSLYDEVSLHIHSMGISSSVDGIAISLLADQLSQYLKLRAMILADGLIVETISSTGASIQKPHAALGQMNINYNNINKLLTEYGLTAASRAKVGANNPVVVDSFEDFLNT
mgnify:CR=1 FL=1